jgi:hypothetical protein
MSCVLLAFQDLISGRRSWNSICDIFIMSVYAQVMDIQMVFPLFVSRRSTAVFHSSSDISEGFEPAGVIPPNTVSL